MTNEKSITYISRSRIQVFTISFLSGIALFVLAILVFLLPEVDQPALTIPLVFFSVVFAVSWCTPSARNRLDGKLDWFHPSILLMMVYIAYFVFSGTLLGLYHDYNSIWVDLGNRPIFLVNTVFCIGVVSVFSFGLGIRAKPVSFGRSITRLFSQSSPFNWRRMRYFILAFLLIGLMFKYYHLTLLGPLTTNLFRYLSPSANRQLGISISQFFIMLESMLDWGALLAVFYYIVRYRETGKAKGWLLVLLFVVIIAAFGYIVSAKRTAVIPLFLLPLIWYHYLVRRLSIGRAGMYFLAGMLLIVGLLMARIVLPLLVQNLAPADYMGKSASKIAAFYADSSEWCTFDMISASVVQRDRLLREAGGSVVGPLKYSFNTLIVFVPRALWPGKPLYEDISHVYYRVLIDKYKTTVGVSATFWGTSFLFFHLPGLVVGMYVLGWLFKSVYALLQLQNGRPFNVFLYSVFYWMVFQFLRFGTLGFVILLFLQTMVVGVLAIIVLRRRERAAEVQSS